MATEFTLEQLAYIDSNIDEHVFLEACPGSGKTEVVAAKVAKEIDSWVKFPGGIAALSFSNSATNELTNRVIKYLQKSGIQYPHFIGTFDSFILKNLVSPLSTELTGYRGENRDASLRIIEPDAALWFKTKYGIAGQGKILAHHYGFDSINESLVFNTGSSLRDRKLKSAKLKDWELNDLLEAKKKLLSGGFATYRDIQGLAVQALSDEDCSEYVELLAKRYPIIIIDECQDLSDEQLFILKKLSDLGVKLHFIGDLHQAIYSFRDVDPIKVKHFVQENKFLQLQLTRNFRSCQNIIDLCSQLTGRKSITGNVSWFDPRCLVVQYQNCPTEVTEILSDKCADYSNSVLVSRGHSLIRKFQSSITEPRHLEKLALSILLFEPSDFNKLKQSLKYFSEFLRYHLKKEVYKPNSFNCPEFIESNLQWRKFLHDALDYLVANGAQNLDSKWPEWTKNIKMLVRSLPEQHFCTDSIRCVMAPLDKVNLSSPTGSKQNTVSSTLGAKKANLSVFKSTTIHGAKGETHDATIVISSASGGNDSNWKSWLKEPDSEAARFAYVASSRPRHLLIWVVKTLTAIETTQLRSKGFTII